MAQQGTTRYNKAQQAQQGPTIGATRAIFFWHDCHKAHILLHGTYVSQAGRIHSGDDVRLIQVE
eukprot:scaffold197677_cov50-Cyclotella_meneghiniana.AAC.3